MILLYILILVVLIVLWLWAVLSKTSVPYVETGYSRIFLGPAVLIHHWAVSVSRRILKGRNNPSRRMLKDRRLLTDLQTLNPGEQPGRLIENYRIELISTVMLIIGAGAFICLAVSLMAMNEGVLKDGDVIYRNTYGGMNVEADLSAGITVDEAKEDYPLSITVEPRIYSYEQADQMFNDLSQKIDALILADNDSADHILYPVDLVRSVEGYPFSINWEWNDYELLDYDGAVHNEELDEPKIVTLIGDCTYLGDHWYIARDIQICPMELTWRQQTEAEIIDAINLADEMSASEDKLTLPGEVSKGRIIWSENIEDMSPVIMLAILLIAVFLIPYRESELRSRIKQRSRELLIEYPAFVSQLTLYMGAGMSVRNCLLKLGHKSGSRTMGDGSYLDRELCICAHELEVGISEAEAVEHFGRRCATREYMRFGALLIQNMKKGSTDLIRVLKEESEDAFILRKNEARKLGEEASTKLLLPMVMMLTVVMIIIMVPAYMSFSS